MTAKNSHYYKLCEHIGLNNGLNLNLTRQEFYADPEQLVFRKDGRANIHIHMILDHVNQYSKFIITFVCRCSDFINCDKIRFNIVNNNFYISIKINGHIHTVKLEDINSDETDFFRKLLKLTEIKELLAFLNYCRNVYILYFDKMSSRIIRNIDDIAERMK